MSSVTRRWPFPELREGARVLVIAAAGTANTGDDAMLAGLLRRLGDGVRPVVTSRDPDATRRVFDVDAIPPWRAALAAATADAVVIGGGALFSAHMGARGRLIPAVALAAQSARKPVALVGVSIDASTPRTVAPLLRALARRAGFIGVRDAASVALFEAMGARAVIEPDLSAWMETAPPAAAERFLREAGVDPRRLAVALCLTATDPPIAAAIAHMLPQVARALPRVQFCVIPMSEHASVPSHNDRRFAEALREQMPGLAIARRPERPVEALALLGAFDAAVCMRFHSLVFAERARVPIVAVPYAPKCDAWCDEHGIAPTPPTAKRLTAAIAAALGARAEGLAG